MASDKYTGTVPVVPRAHFDQTTLRGKSVVITGGASGLGEEFVRTFASAGAFVTISDFNSERGQKLSHELGQNVQFVQCDVTRWSDQVAVFKAAVSQSPSKSCDIVLANAGISGPDPPDTLLSNHLDSEEPVEPNLKILNTNCIGVIYTVKLAMHYFNRQPETLGRDRCIILTGSLASYLDQPGSPQYNVSKWGVRALMRCLRRTSWQTNFRINLIAPWYIRTPILTAEVQRHVESKGVDFALSSDAAAAVLHLASDKTINGKTTCRALGIVPHSFNEQGYIDLQHDDYPEDDFLREWQEVVLNTSHRTAVSIACSNILCRKR
ncbi:short chain dehydrogenase reductase [Lepidopterella palustris CBS 459.81]|uniref:Short chain dehydrogenase reductase n=1 Tax=Lepidopterella palustris CBS 459.81 TaxID=1314670 RepID=A0A8E2EBE8_9PEZI|nr:short chain dehydrogenase reductase [Lepidopterella palustris CBS 459.81]